MSKLLKALQGVEAPKVSLREVQGMTYQAQPVQATRTEVTNYGSQLIGLGQAVGQAGQAYVDERKRVGEQRKNEILLKNMKPGEIGEMRKSGILLYQDDPYAMRALEKELGRQEAYNVDATVRERIARGDYNSRREMEADRAALMETSQKEMGLAYGMPDGGTEWFSKGYQSDITERNMAIYDAQARKQDEMMRNESRLVVENNMSDIIKSGGEPSGLVTYLDNQRANGVIRNDVEYEVFLTKSLKDAASRPDGVQAVDALLNAEITIDGQKTTLRTRMGEEAYNSYKLKAADSVFSQEWENQKWFMQGIDFITNLDGTSPTDYEKGMDKINEMEAVLAKAEGTPQATQAKIQLENAKFKLRDNLARGNEENKKALKKKIQQGNRYLRMRERFEQALAGEAVPLSLDSFVESEMTGKYETNDYASFHEQYTAEIQADPNLTDAQKQSKYMRAGNLFKSVDKAGFGAWYTAQFGQIERELQDYDLANQYGKDLPDTPTLNNYKALYNADPQEFMSVFGEDATTALDIGMLAQMNIDPSTYRKGKKALAAMSQEERAFKSQQWMTAIDKRESGKIIDKLTPAEQQMYMAFYSGMDGLGNAAKMQAIETHINANYQAVDFSSSGMFSDGRTSTGVVRKNLLMLDAKNPKSADEGAAALKSFVGEMYGDNSFTSISSTDDNIIIRNAMGQVTYLTRQELINYSKGKPQ